MGTRGLFGFRLDGQDKLTYCHFDSYPESLGEKCIKATREQLAEDPTLEAMRDAVRVIRLIDDNVPPTEEDIEKLAPWTDLSVSRRSTSDWYCLTRELQGKPAEILKAGLMLDSADFIVNSLMCEWAYVINLDDNLLEVYRGFQHNKHSLGRYSDLAPMKYNIDAQYYPCALIAAFPLNSLPKKLVDALPKEEDE